MKITNAVCRIGLDPLPLIMWESGQWSRLRAIGEYRQRAAAARASRSVRGGQYAGLVRILERMGDYPGRRTQVSTEEAATRLWGAICGQ